MGSLPSDVEPYKQFSIEARSLSLQRKDCQFYGLFEAPLLYPPIPASCATSDGFKLQYSHKWGVWLLSLLARVRVLGLDQKVC